MLFSRSRAARLEGWELESDTSRRGASVKGRACTIFFHAETQRTAADVAVIASPLDLFGGRVDGDATALAKVIVLQLLVPASAGAGARHREVAARWAQVKPRVEGAEKRRSRLETRSATSSRRVRSVGRSMTAPHRFGPRVRAGASGRARRTRQLAGNRRQAIIPGSARQVPSLLV